MNDAYESLKSRLVTYQTRRKDYLTVKTQKLKLMNKSNISNTSPSESNSLNEMNIKKLLNEELNEIDRQIESLTSIIETSNNIGNLIINYQTFK